MGIGLSKNLYVLCWAGLAQILIAPLHADSSTAHLRRKAFSVYSNREDSETISAEEKEVGVDWKKKISLKTSDLLSESFTFNLDGRRMLAERHPKGLQGEHLKKEGDSIERIVSGEFRRVNSKGKPFGQAGQYKIAWLLNAKKSVAVATFWTRSQSSFSIISSTGFAGSKAVARHFMPGYAPTCETNENTPERSVKPISLSSNKIRAAVSYETPVINVMVAYTAGALSKIYGPDKVLSLEEAILRIKANALLDIGFMNTHLENSGVDAKTKLVCDPYPLEDLGDPNLEKNGAQVAAREQGDGIWDEIHEVRAQCGADLVLIYPYYGGVSHILKIPHAAAGRNAFMADFFDGSANPSYFIFDHEGGHALGLAHESANGLGNGLAYDSNGYVFSAGGKKYRDLMNSGADLTTSVEVPYFSNPELSFMGEPLGEYGLSNAAQTLQFSTHIASEFAESLVYPSENAHSFSLYIERFPDSSVMHLVGGHTSSDIPEIAFTNGVRMWGVSISGKHLKVGDYPFDTQGFRSEVFTTGTYYLSLYPDLYVKSSEFTFTDFQFGSITASIVNDSLQGKVIHASSGAPITATGNWLTVQYRHLPDSEFTTIAHIGTDAQGNFTMPLQYTGYYKVSYIKNSISDNRITSSIITYTGGAAPSSLATPTVNTIPSTAIPTPTLFIIPTMTPTQTATPTKTPIPEKPPVQFKLANPKYFDTYALVRGALSVKKNGSYVPAENVKIGMICADGEKMFRKLTITKKAGEFSFKVALPDSEPYICYVRFEKYSSGKFTIKSGD